MSSVISAEGLVKAFGPHRAVDGIDLDVAAGQVFGFLGPNGAGKSTTIRMLLGLFLPTSGRVEVFGLDVRRHGTDVRRRTGYLPGELALYPKLTGREYLDRCARMRGGSTTRRNALETRFAADIDRPVHTLSKGNRQKIGLVAAFMHDPELLVLDEPTSGLDPLLQREFAALLEETVARGRTVFLSSHDLDEVQRLAHQVAIIREGRIVVSDTIEALRSRSPRTIVLTFHAPVDAATFDGLPGVHVTSVEEPRVTFRVDGSEAGIGRLFEAAVPLGIADVSARTANLDELFLTFYSREDAHVG
jgi:ABC-2 type transport system ATP-binding protein